MARPLADERETAYVLTGHLPEPDIVQSLVNEAERRFKSNHDGANSQIYAALARGRSELFGVCVVGTGGQVCGAGDVDYEFTIMSLSKPFLFALVCETIGPEEARAKLDANATGLPFNSLAAIEHGSGRTASAIVLLLSFHLKPDHGRPDVEMDLTVGLVWLARLPVMNRP